MDSDGYSVDNSRKKIKDDYPIPVTIQEFKDKENKAQNNRGKKHFFVPIDEIIKNDLALNYNLYRNYEYEETNYEPPAVLLKQLIDLEKEISEMYKQINSSIHEN
jgi:type I restriction enzyme M protein